MADTIRLKGFGRIIWYGELNNGENGWVTFGYAGKSGFFLEVCKRGFDTGGLGCVTVGELLWVASTESILNELPKRDSERPTAWDWERVVAHNIVEKYPVDRNSQPFKENVPAGSAKFILQRFESELKEWIRSVYKR